MTGRNRRVGILYAGDSEARRSATRENGRFLKVFEAFDALGIKAEPVIYHDDFCDEVKQQISELGAVVVWVNPIEGARYRYPLTALLCLSSNECNRRRV